MSKCPHATLRIITSNPKIVVYRCEVCKEFIESRW